MNDAHLHNAARALERVLAAKHPQFVWTVRVRDSPVAQVESEVQKVTPRRVNGRGHDNEERRFSDAA